MTTLRHWFDGFADATGERPTAIVFGGKHNWHRDQPEWSPLGMWRELEPGRVYAMDDVPDDVLDREFDDGYGGAEGPPLHAWSDSWVLFAHEYDGSEDLRWLPRHPNDYVPHHDGYYARAKRISEGATA